MALDENTKRLIAIDEKLYSRKSGWDRHCQMVAEQYYPLRANFTKTLSLGADDFMGDTMESTPILNRDQLGSAIDAMLRQKSWFQVGTGDKERDSRQDNALALASATNQLRSLVNDRRANTSKALKEADQDWVTFGQPCLSVEGNMADGHIITRAWHPRDIAITTDTYGRVDGVHRKISMEARQICANFDKGRWMGTLDPKVRKACEGKEPHKEFNIRHIVMPMEEVYGSDRAMQRRHRNAPWLSLYVDMDNKTILNEAHTFVFPYVVPRWITLSGMLEYGFSPLALNSLADARMIQQIALTVLEQGQKAVDPPLVLGQEFLGRDVNLYAGGATYIDIPDGRAIKDIMSPIDTSGRVNFGFEIKKDVRELLAQGWLLNKLFLPDLREMTAYEASQRVEEFRRAALPFFVPIQTEYHEAWLGTCWDVGVQMNLIDATGFPADLRGREIVFQFFSPLEEAEGQQIVAAFQQTMSIVAAGAQVDNSVARLLDVGAAVTDAVRGTGEHPNWLIPDDAQQKVKDQAQQDKELAAMAQRLSMGAALAQQISGGVLASRQAGLLKGPPGAMEPNLPPGAAPPQLPAPAGTPTQ